MADSFATVLISAGVGGVAGSVFPAVKEAISFVALDANSQIEKLAAEMKTQVEAFQNRQSFKDEVTKHTQELFELVKQGQKLFMSYRAGSSFNDVGIATLTVDLQQAKAYLGPFDMKSRLSPEAATHITTSIAFADQMLDILRQMRLNEFTDKQLLHRDQGDGPPHIALMGKLMELQAGTVGSLQLWAIAEQEANAGSRRQATETDRLIRDLKRKRHLSVIFLGAMAVAAVIIVAVLVHVQSMGLGVSTKDISK